jgi:Mn2+/Fe2+ NRAMP family transporter
VKLLANKRARVLIFLGAIGPGILTAMAGNDAGGISTFSVAGAEYGYATLWLIPIMTLQLAVVQETVSRMGAVSGKGFAALIREKFGLRPSLLAMGLLLLSNLATSVSEFAGIAAATSVLGVSKYISVPIAAVVVWLLVVRGSYRNVEKILLGLSAVFVAYIGAMALSNPNWGDVIKSTFVPTVIPTEGFIVIAIAAIGTTVAPWMQFFQQANVVDKGITAKDIKTQRIDVIAGAVAAGFIAWAIVVTTGTVLFPEGIRVSDAGSAALALEPALGQYATALFAIGLFSASLLAACVLPLTAAYAVCEAFGWERGLDRSWSEAPAFNAIYTFVIAFGAAFVLIPDLDLILLMVFSQFVGGILLPFLLVYMIKIANDQRIMGRYVNSRPINVISWATVIVIVALTFILLGMSAVGMV